jgi:phosphoribosyl 1,2-cyclic phosphate phosphodiesterase
MIGDSHRVDLPPDAYCQMAKLGLDFSCLEYVFFTHTHPDHFAAEQLQYTAQPFAFERANEPVQVFGSPTAVTKLRERLGNPKDYPINIHEITAFRSVNAGDVTFTPILAPHKPDDPSLNYVIESNGRTLLYACDTGYYDESTWEYLAGVQLDCVICECTNGFAQTTKGHMSFPEVLKMRDTLESSGSLAGNARFVLTHLSHTIGMMHDEIAQETAPYGIEVGYDGMRIEV